MYVLDTNIFISFGHYFPRRFPTIWNKIDTLTSNGDIISVREVRHELDSACSVEHVLKWINNNKHIFKIATNDECEIVKQIFEYPQYRGFIKRKNMLIGMPVADPFIIAAAKVRDFIVVTQESYKKGGARIPNACKDFDVKCIDLEGFFENEDIIF